MNSRLATFAKASTLAAAALVTVGAGIAAAPQQAEAKGFRLHVHIGPGYHHRHYRPWRRFRRCRWLRRRAHFTGSPYWYRRYRRCMWRNYY